MFSFASSVIEKNNNSPVAPLVHVTPVIKGLAGSVGGTVEACCLQPIDVIKTRLQLDKVGKYKGIVNCGNTIVREEGIKALWKGLTPFAAHLTLKYALRMGTNATFQSFLRDKDGKLSSQSRMLAGFGAGVTEAIVIVTPFEVVKIKLQQQKGCAINGLKYKGPFHCAGTILKEEGPKGLWAGVTPTILRNGTNQMCLFYMKNVFDIFYWNKHEGDGRTLAPWQSMISGFSAAFAGPIATGPFDVAKTRLMAQEKSETGHKPYKGFFHCIARVFREEGVLALYKGLLPRLMRIPPGQAITWAVADQLVGLYEKTYENLRHT